MVFFIHGHSRRSIAIITYNPICFVIVTFFQSQFAPHGPMDSCPSMAWPSRIALAKKQKRQLAHKTVGDYHHEFVNVAQRLDAEFSDLGPGFVRKPIGYSMHAHIAIAKPRMFTRIF